jgi:hypothetical protein
MALPMAASERGTPRVGLAVLRRAIADRVASGSLRRVAREIGMSAPGLRSFLDGGTPYEATRRKLVAWYVVRSGDEADELTSAAVEAVLALLLGHLPSSKRAEARAAVIRVLATATKRAGVKAPTWLDA